MDVFCQVSSVDSIIDQFPKLPTTAEEAWYCYCSVDRTILKLFVRCLSWRPEKWQLQSWPTLFFGPLRVKVLYGT